MIQVTLKSHEFCAVELPCDHTLASLPVRAIGGKCILAIQSSGDGLTWSSPIAHARLGSKPMIIKFSLPESARKIRAIIENASSKPAYLEIEDASDTVERNAATA